MVPANLSPSNLQSEFFKGAKSQIKAIASTVVKGIVHIMLRPNRMVVIQGVHIYRELPPAFLKAGGNLSHSA